MQITSAWDEPQPIDSVQRCWSASHTETPSSITGFLLSAMNCLCCLIFTSTWMLAPCWATRLEVDWSVYSENWTPTRMGRCPNIFDLDLVPFFRQTSQLCTSTKVSARQSSSSSNDLLPCGKPSLPLRTSPLFIASLAVRNPQWRDFFRPARVLRHSCDRRNSRDARVSATAGYSYSDSSMNDCSSMLWNTLLDDVDFNYYHSTILELLEEFNCHCSSVMGNIDYVSFLQIILQRTATSKVDRLSMEFEYLVPMIKTMKINRLYFVTLIPAMIFMESTLRREKTLYRLRDHSMLDSLLTRT